MTTNVPRASSVTHTHLLACANTELRRRHPNGPVRVRVLDAGCGNGALIAHLTAGLRSLNPSWIVEVFGYDVGDHGVQADGFLNESVERLAVSFPEVDWRTRIREITVDAPWPFEDETFDLVLSNQVLEHVADHGHFFREVARTLKAGGASSHLFPLRHYLYEGHLLLPMVHRIHSHDARVEYIALLSKLGLGKFRGHHANSGVSLSDFSDRHADYMNYWTNYLSEQEMLGAASRAHLRASFRYTPEFYAQKVRAMRHLSATTEYRDSGRGFKDSVAVKALRYVSSVTLTLEKNDTY